jgi:hypothetical protein
MLFLLIVIYYNHAIGQLLDWFQRAGFQSLEDIEPITVAAYIEQHPGSPPTVKQHMTAIRMLFSWLSEKWILAMNPAREVKTQKFSRTEGKTPAPPSKRTRHPGFPPVRLIRPANNPRGSGWRERELLGAE